MVSGERVDGMDPVWCSHVVASVIVAGASLVQGVVGFGFGLICVPLLSLLFSPTQAVGINFVIGSLNVLIILAMLWRKVDLRRMVVLIIISLVFAVPGAFILVVLDRRMALIAIGASICLLAAFSLINRNRQVAVFRHPGFGYGAATVSGFLMGAFTLAGPPMIVYLHQTGMPKEDVKANVQFYFCVLNLFVLPFFIRNGVVTVESSLNGLALAPIVVVFTAIGVMAGRRLSADLVGILVNGLLLALGGFMVIANAFFPAPG
jgi:uncharacterized membrane protein YfcA